MRFKACWKITDNKTGKLICYTRNPEVLKFYRPMAAQSPHAKYKFHFISRTPKAIEVLYLED